MPISDVNCFLFSVAVVRCGAGVRVVLPLTFDMPQQILLSLVISFRLVNRKNRTSLGLLFDTLHLCRTGC